MLLLERAAENLKLQYRLVGGIVKCAGVWRLVVEGWEDCHDHRNNDQNTNDDHADAGCLTGFFMK